MVHRTPEGSSNGCTVLDRIVPDMTLSLEVALDVEQSGCYEPPVSVGSGRYPYVGDMTPDRRDRFGTHAVELRTGSGTEHVVRIRCSDAILVSRSVSGSPGNWEETYPIE